MSYRHHIQIERALRAHYWGDKKYAYQLMIPVLIDVVNNKETADGPPKQEAHQSSEETGQETEHG